MRWIAALTDERCLPASTRHHVPRHTWPADLRPPNSAGLALLAMIPALGLLGSQPIMRQVADYEQWDWVEADVTVVFLRCYLLNLCGLASVESRF